MVHNYIGSTAYGLVNAVAAHWLLNAEYRAAMGYLLSELHIIFGTQKENSRRHGVAQEVQSHTDEVEDSRIEVNCCLVHGRIERCRSQRGNGLQGSS